MNQPALKYKLNEEFVWEPMPDGSILYAQSSGQIITVNPVTELILSFCDGETTLPQIFATILEDVPIEQSSFDEAIQKLIAEKVLLPV